MIVAALEARARPLPDGAENCALSMACASSAGVAACEAARLAPCLAACAASATSNAAQKSAAAPAPRAQRPIRNVPSIRTTRNDQNGRECPWRRREGKRLLGLCQKRSTARTFAWLPALSNPITCCDITSIALRERAMRRTLIPLTSFAFLALGWPCAADDITSPIVGLWKLTGTTTKNVATGVLERQYGDRPSGYQLSAKAAI